MTDAVLSYHEDVAIRSVQKKSAMHKNNGSAVTKLGNKRMTDKEIVERHGPVESYDLNIFMDFNTFKSMPHDLQIEYINRLQDEYDIGLMQISKALFNLDNEGLRTHLRINKILDKCKPNVKRGKTGYQKFLDDVDEQRRREKFAKSIDISETKAREKETGVPSGFITYNEYLNFGPEERLKYVNGLMTKWNVGMSMISTCLFEKSASLLSVYFGETNLRQNVKKLGSIARSPVVMQNYNKAFTTAVNNWREERNGATEMKSDIPAVEFKVDDETKTIAAVIEEPKAKVAKTPVASNCAEEPAKSDIFQGSRFVADYTALGVDAKQLEALVSLFDGKTVHVRIQVTEIS